MVLRWIKEFFEPAPPYRPTPQPPCQLHGHVGLCIPCWSKAGADAAKLLTPCPRHPDLKPDDNCLCIAGAQKALLTPCDRHGREHCLICVQDKLLTDEPFSDADRISEYRGAGHTRSRFARWE